MASLFLSLLSLSLSLFSIVVYLYLEVHGMVILCVGVGESERVDVYKVIKKVNCCRVV